MPGHRKENRVAVNCPRYSSQSGRGISNRPCSRPDKDSHAPIRHNGGMTDDDIIQLIETFDFDAGPVAVARRNRGFTLIHAETGVPIARVPSDATISSTSSIGHSGKNDGCRSAPLDALPLPSNRPCALSRKHQSFGPASETSGQKSAKSSKVHALVRILFAQPVITYLILH